MRVGADDFDPRGVAVRRISDARGFGGVATRPIAAGDVLVVVPLTKMITSESVLRDARLGACATSLSAYQVRSIQKFFTHRSVSTFDRYPFQLTGELFLYGMALRGSR
jgi:allophanate hydrolase subunit 2